MSLKQISEIQNREKQLIMEAIFKNYKEISKLKEHNLIKINSEQMSKVQLFALTDSIINLMEKTEKNIIKNNFILDNKIMDKTKLNNAIDKFVFYLLA